MKHWFGRLRLKVLAFGIAMSVLPLSVFGFYSLQAAARAQVEIVQAQNQVAARSVADQLAHVISQINTQLGLLSRLGGGRLPGGGRAEQERALYTLLRDLPYMEDVALVNSDGQEVVRASRRELTTGVDLPSHAGTQLWQELQQGGPALGPVTLDLDGRPLLQVGFPLPDRSGALVGRTTLRGLVAEVASTRDGEASQLYLLDETGRLIGGTDFSLVLQGLVFSKSVQGDSPYLSVMGQEVLGVSAPVPGLPWRVIGETTLAGAMAPVRRLAGEFALAAILLMGAVAALSVVFGLQLTEPLERLEAGANRVGAGDLAWRIPPGGRDELGRLVDAFNTMTDRLHMTLQSEKLAAVGQLAAGVAHEINNPLAVISAYAEDLQDRLTEGAADLAQSGELGEYLVQLQVQVRRCKGITGNLLDFARHQLAEPEDVDLKAVAAQTAALLNHRACKAGITIGLPERPVLVHGTRDHLQQILLNLMTNALDAFEEAGMPGEIRLTALPNGERVVLEVADTGPGMAPEVLERALEPFFTTKSVGKGTGLGLSICYGLVTGMGGQMRLESAPSTGTRVLLTLPGVSL